VTRGGSQQYDERESRGGGDNAGDNAGGRRLLAAAPDNGAWYQRGGRLRGHRGLEGRVGASEVAGCGLQWRGNSAKLNGDDTGGGNGNGTIEARDKDERERLW
jgi:hypothetical protein